MIPFSHLLYRIADDGSLVYVEDTESAVRFTLALVDRATGAVEEMDVPRADYRHPRIAPDGQRFVVRVRDDDGDALWIHDISGTAAPRRLTLEGEVSTAVWDARRRGHHLLPRTGICTRFLRMEPECPNSWSPGGPPRGPGLVTDGFSPTR